MSLARPSGCYAWPLNRTRGRDLDGLVLGCSLSHFAIKCNTASRSAWLAVSGSNIPDLTLYTFLHTSLFSGQTLRCQTESSLYRQPDTSPLPCCPHFSIFGLVFFKLRSPRLDYGSAQSVAVASRPTAQFAHLKKDLPHFGCRPEGENLTCSIR